METLINFLKTKNHALKPPAKPAFEIQEEIFNEDLLTRNLDCRDQVVLNTVVYLIRKSNPPICDIYDCQISVKHTLVNCSRSRC